MKTKFVFALASVLLFLALLSSAEGQAVFQTDSFRLEISSDGSLKSIASKQDGTELARTFEPGPIAVVYRGGRAVPEFPDEYAAFTGRWIYRGGESFPGPGIQLKGSQ